MAFRKAGRAPTWHPKFHAKKLEHVNRFRYLGVTLTPAFSMTPHLNEIAAKCATATATLGNLKKFCIGSNIDIWRMKLRPRVTYAAGATIAKCTATNLRALDGIKARFLKKCLGVAMSTSNTLAFHICEEPTLVDELCARGLPVDRDALASYNESREEKERTFRNKGYEYGPAFQMREWRSSLQEPLRTAVCRTTAHGFHHLLCNEEHRYHEPSEGCICKFCWAECDDRYHVIYCVAFEGKGIVNRVRKLQGPP